MDHHLIAKNNMYKKLLLFFADIKNSVIWANFQRLKDEIANFVSLNTTLDKYIQEHQIDITRITTDKNNAFADMINITVNKAHKAYVWALDKNNADLTQPFDIQKTDFTHLAESMAFTRVKNIRDAINTNIADMASVNLTTDDVDLID